jgi:hypothetical protein
LDEPIFRFLRLDNPNSSLVLNYMYGEVWLKKWWWGFKLSQPKRLKDSICFKKWNLSGRYFNA